MSTSFSTPKKQKPNPHPYAIKTTSTGLLSQNSSSSSIASGAHHYIPPSPSPSPTQTGSYSSAFGTTRVTRHRYSTSESPRPLPPPPSAAGLLGNDDGDDDDDTPRRVQRAYSLPQEIKLPEDPKRWTPAEVSIYLTYSLNAASGGGGGRDLPTPVAHDIATFVKDKKITGRRFLRLNEVDLEEYGINQRWITTLVDASRALRRNVLRGRIWGSNPTERDNKVNDYDDDNNNHHLSSNSNYVITNRKRSLSATSESRGRVRDMIDTLERSSSTSGSEPDEGGGYTRNGRKNKDTASKRDKHHHRRRSLEQQQYQPQEQPLLQQQGRLPQRGSVSTLFASGTSGPGPEREVEDEESTITAHTRRTVNANEPRLLPFPPTGTSNRHYAHVVSPSHTGTSHSLPPSPLDLAQNQQTAPYHTQPLHHQPFIFPSQSQQNHTPPITLDYYELGFKNSFPLSPPIRSPNSQRYVVQHNHVQPSLSSLSTTPGVGSHSTGGSGKGSRLLPYPPIVGEAELFHPRPRMGVGVGGLAGGLEDGLDEDAEEDEEGDESTYHSALDIETGISDSENGDSGEGSSAVSEETPGSENEIDVDIETRVESDPTDGVEHSEKVKEEGGGEEEPSIQELLLAQSQTRPRVISGVEAWEIELGETVKRISNNGSSSAAPAESISSIGGTKIRTRPRKRELIDETGRMSGKMSEVNSLSKKMMTSVLGPELFEAPNSCAEGDTVDAKESEASVPLPDSATFASTSSDHPSTISRQSALDERESSIAILESSLSVRESSIAERDSLITQRESSIADRESSLDIRESSVISRESTVSELESAITARESAITTYETEIQRRMGDIQQREMEVEKRECEVEKREQEVSEREMRVEKRESEVEKRVSERETRVERREEEVKEWYQRKLSEIDERMLVVDVPPPPPITASAASSSTPTASTCTCTANSKWPPSPVEFARRLCATYLLPVLGEERTPKILLPSNGAADSSTTSSSTTTSSTSTTSTSTTSTSQTRPGLPFWSLKRDFFLNRLLGATVGGGSFLVLVGIGICVILLRGVVRRVLRVGGFGRR